jgi:hypothetical protein
MPTGRFQHGPGALAQLGSFKFSEGSDHLLHDRPRFRHSSAPRDRVELRRRHFDDTAAPPPYAHDNESRAYKKAMDLP